MSITAILPDPAVAESVRQVRSQLVGATAEQASATFEVKTRLIGGVAADAKIRQFDLRIDEPPTLGGNDTGPNPVELVLAALGTCQEIVYSVYASSLGIDLDKVEVTVSGDLDPRGFYGVADVPAGFQSVKYDVKLESSASADEIRKLAETVDRHCPVLDILQRALPVSGNVSLNGNGI